MSEHTPGPWWVDDRRPRGSLQVNAKHRGEGSSYCVASMNYWEGSANEANAKLIAAAPDLLALAHQYASECAECNGTGTADAWEDNVPGDITKGVHATTMDCEDCADIRAVIAKAEGSSS